MEHKILKLFPDIKTDLLNNLKHVLVWKYSSLDEDEFLSLCQEPLDRLLFIVDKYSIKLNSVMKGGNVALVVGGCMNDKEVVIKINPLGVNIHEPSFLQSFEATGCGVQILAVEDNNNTFIMEKFGSSLASGHSGSLKEKIEYVAKLVKDMQKVKLPHSFLPLSQQAHKELDSLPEKDKEQLADFIQYFSQPNQDWRLLHYDIQDHNILLDNNSCKFVDPKCYYGDKHFENYLLISASNKLFMKALYFDKISEKQMLQYIHYYAQITEMNVEKLLQTLYLRVQIALHKNQELKKDTHYQHRLEWMGGLKIMEGLLSQELF